MTCVTAGGTFGKGIVVKRCHIFFCFNVIFPTSMNLWVLMVAIPDSAFVLELIIAVFSRY